MRTAATDAVTIGSAPPARTVGPLTRTHFVRYQGASGDMNPIHHDDEFARRAGFPSVFSVGMLQAGMLAAFAADWLGPENLRRLEVQFREQAWPGDILTLTAEVVAVEDDDGRRVAVLDVRCTRDTGSVAVRGTATFVLP